MRSALAFISALLVAAPALAAPSEFEAMDADRDGLISPREHAVWARRMFSEAGGGSSSPAADGIRLVDPNRDGVLTLEEHEAASRAIFRQMDTNWDGMLSPAEYEAGHAALKRAK